MGSMLPKPVTTKVIERRGNKRYRVGAASMNGWRTAMEDDHSIHLTDEAAFFGIFDGHVGPACARFLAKRFPELLGKMETPLKDEQLCRMCLDLDKEFLATGSNDGSTGTFFIARPTKAGRYQLQVGNVGDSRVIVSKGYSAYPMTTDHKPAAPGERARIEAAGGQVAEGRVDGRLAVSRAFGDGEYKQGTTDERSHRVVAVPDVTHVECGVEDFVFLSCDGVFERSFPNEAVISFIHERLAQTNDLGLVASMVCDEALQRGSKDNVSCMIVTFADGSDYAREQQPELLLGPCNAPDSELFVTAYTSALGSQMTLAEAVLKRYDEVVARLPQRIEATGTDLQKKRCAADRLNDSELRLLVSSQRGADQNTHDALCGFTRQALLKAVAELEAKEQPCIPIDIRDMQEELSLFSSSGPSGTVKPPQKGEPNRLAWFQKWLDEKAAAGAAGGGGGGSNDMMAALLRRMQLMV